MPTTPWKSPPRRAKASRTCSRPSCIVSLPPRASGTLHKGQRIRLMSTGAAYQVDRVGIFRPKQEMRDRLDPGEIGFFTASIRQVADTRVGDTVTDEKKPASAPLA